MHCTPCNTNTAPLTKEQANEKLRSLSGWELVMDGKAISRRFVFKDFAQGVAFVNKIAPIADAEDHHPDLKLGWGYVECMFWTHSIGGLHENDFIMAQKVSALAA